MKKIIWNLSKLFFKTWPLSWRIKLGNFLQCEEANGRMWDELKEIKKDNSQGYKDMLDKFQYSVGLNRSYKKNSTRRGYYTPLDCYLTSLKN